MDTRPLCHFRDCAFILSLSSMNVHSPMPIVDTFLFLIDGVPANAMPQLDFHASQRENSGNSLTFPSRALHWTVLHHKGI